MKHRGFKFALASPLLQAGWHLEAATREVAITGRALQASREQLDAQRQQQSELLAQCAPTQGRHLDLRLRDLQLRRLADLEARCVAAAEAVDERHVAWKAAVDECARRQQRVDGLNEVRDRQRAAFELEQRRAEARRADDDWLMRQRGAPMDREAI